MDEKWYQRGYRRMLIDMHIADWDERFLSLYDPSNIVRCLKREGLTSAMFYCESHVGLCYWPTRAGKMHAGLQGRDVVAEMLKLLKDEQIDACGYYSVIYNNWAYLEHPEWRMEPACCSLDGSLAGERYGHCCPNNPDYRVFAMAQLEELVGTYRFDGFFFDMVFWPEICVCRSCRDLYRSETGRDIPAVIDWTSTEWCGFQAARERWISEFAGALSGKVKSIDPAMSVYHNFATVTFNWTLGLPASSAVHHDFLGADFYGDATEQMMVSKLMTNLSRNKPVEFMTSVCANLRDHVRLKSYEQLEMQAFAATLFCGAFLFIDAIDLDGTINPEVYDMIGKIYAATSPFEPYLGGSEVADIGVYFSSDSKMDFAENGLSIRDSAMWKGDYPHLQAIRGVCRILQEAHLPFTVITRMELERLDHYRVVILPNVLRMDKDEVKALREYVRNGGNIYSSRYTSLTETCGIRHSDFMLADVFGCHFEEDALGKINYGKPVDQDIAEAIAPQKYISQFQLISHTANDAGSSGGTLLMDKSLEGRALATLTVPYASPKAGTIFDKNWASIHSFPPWDDTDHPLMVENVFGRGRSIYSGADIESIGSEANDAVFLTLIRSLMDQSPSYTADVHPAVWMSVFHQPENNRFLIGFLNYQSQLPAIPIETVPFTLRAVSGKRFTRLVSLPGDTEVAFRSDADGALSSQVKNLRVFKMLAAMYEDVFDARFRSTAASRSSDVSPETHG